LVELQLRVAALPVVTLGELALRVTVGAAGGVSFVTVTDVVALLMPPAPVQDNIKLAVAVSAAVGLLPFVGTAPLQAPEAVHDVAFVELQLIVEVPPEVMLAGEALSEIVGAAVAPDPPPQATSVCNAAMLKLAAAIRVKPSCQFLLFMRAF
jgi:hypothetical protein